MIRHPSAWNSDPWNGNFELDKYFLIGLDTRECERELINSREQWSHLKVWRLLISRLMAGTSSFIGWTFWLRSNSFCNEVQTASLSFLISSTFLSPGRSEIDIRYLRFRTNYWGETAGWCQDAATTDNPDQSYVLFR